MWPMIETVAWVLSGLFAAHMVWDWYRTDTTYSEDILTSSREGEIEAMTEQHKLEGRA